MQTFSIHDLQFTAQLPDGRTYLLREVRPEDAIFLKEGFERLSPKSRFMRFLYPIKQLTERDLKYLTQTDQHNHVAWCAELLSEDSFKGLGIGRFVRIKSNVEHAEIAVTVLDMYQRGGVATHLSCVLYLMAIFHGVKTFKSYISPSNLGLLDKVGPLQSKKVFSDGVYNIDLPAHFIRNSPPFSMVSDEFYNQLHAAMEEWKKGRIA